jgi:uncharacterized protein with NRDE domain
VVRIGLPLFAGAPTAVEEAVASIRVGPLTLPLPGAARMYGTRASTVITIDHAGNVQVVERNVDGPLSQQQAFHFTCDVKQS